MITHVYLAVAAGRPNHEVAWSTRIQPWVGNVTRFAAERTDD